MDVERYWQLFGEMGEDKVVKARSGEALTRRERAGRGNLVTAQG
jgi:hypothetical protein